MHKSLYFNLFLASFYIIFLPQDITTLPLYYTIIICINDALMLLSIIIIIFLLLWVEFFNP
jgi:hypothetical protein